MSKNESKKFKQIFMEILALFVEIIEEYKAMDDSIRNVIDLVESIIISIELKADFDECREWFIQKIQFLITAKFINSEIILIENVN